MDISVVIPAYNEEKTIAGVIRVAKSNAKVKEVIVVSDGSTDHTAKEVKRFGRDVVLLDFKVNKGKGYALYQGIKKVTCPLVVLLDADLSGLKPSHIDRIARPLEKHEADLVLAPIDVLSKKDKPYPEFIKGPYEWLHNNYGALITGQRAGFRDDLAKIRGIKDTRYGVDLLISDYYLARKKKIKKIAFYDIHHSWKEEKWGKPGLKLRVSMYQDILKVFDKLKAKGELVSQGFLPEKNAMRGRKRSWHKAAS